MSAPRSTSLRALRQLGSAATGTGGRQIRRLHILDPAVFPAASRKPARNSSAGAVASLASAPDASVSLRTDTPTSAVTSSPSTASLHTTSTATQQQQPLRQPVDVSFQSRHFTTTRALASVRDQSTIDFAYLPQLSLASAPTEDSFVNLRVPLVPWNIENTGKPPLQDEAEAVVHRPIISTVSGEGTHIAPPSAMTDVTDSGHINFDLHELTESLKSVAGRTGKGGSSDAAVQGSGSPQDIVRQLWNDLVDDIMGPKRSPKPAL